MLVVCLLKLLFISYTAQLSSCYNLDVSQDTIKYLLSPIQQKISDPKPQENAGSARNSPVNQNSYVNQNSTEAPGPIATDIASSYFGYDFTISPSGLSVTVGAPKTANSANPSLQGTAQPGAASGNLLSCPIHDVFTSFALSPTCPSIAPPHAQPGDSYGLSVAVNPEDNQTIACLPTKLHNCTAAVYYPGYCYKRGNARSKWTPDPLTQSRECPSFVLDLIFVLDGSGSVGRPNFELVKNWVKGVAGNFNITDGSTRIGVIQYSHYNSRRLLTDQQYIVTEISLGEYRDQQILFDAISNISLHGYTTYTAYALNKSVLDFMTSDRFNTSSKVLILLTDGKSSDSLQLSASANYVRSLGINTFAVGVGEAQVGELRTVATGTSTNKNVFYVSQFNKLEKIVNRLKAAILTFVLEGSLSSTTIAYRHQYSENGFSIRPGLRRTRRNRRSRVLKAPHRLKK